jgi:beta-lactamase class A
VLIGALVGALALVVVSPSLRGGARPEPTRENPGIVNPAPLANAPAPEAPTQNAPVEPAPDPPNPAVSVDLEALNRLLEAESARLTGTVSVHVRLDGGGEAGRRATEPQPAASVIKLPLMVVLEDAWLTGGLKRVARDEAALRKAITLSDNPSADRIIDQLGTARINTWLEAHGYTQTRLRHKMAGPRPDGVNTVSAAEMTRMALEIAREECVSPEASSEMRTLLLAQTRRTRIPAGLPEGAVSGNKTGTLRGIVNDVAFVETPGGLRYAMAVLITNAGEDAATSKAIAGLSRKVYDLLTASR